MFAEVIIDIAHAKIDRVFSYRVPEDMQLCIGDRVVVPFGAGNHPKEGYVVSFCEQTAYEPEKIKPILQKEDAFSAILPEQVALAQWMAKAYHCFLVDALRLMIPSQMRGGRVKEKTVEVVSVSPNADLEKALEELNGALGGRKAPAQAETLSLIAEVGKISVKELYEFLPSAKSALPQLRKKALVQTEKVAVRRAPYQALARLQKKEHTLTPDQQKAVEAVLPSLASHGGRYLLHGVTGSGKTEVYLQIIRQTLLQNKGCIVLVPEISLTPQMVARFRAFLGENVAVLHSRLSAGERYDEWKRILTGKARVVIGPRSAVFAPIQNLGLIIIDEEHEQSYRSEHKPQYTAHEVAEKRCALSGATLVLGSATPSVVTYHRCMEGEYTYLSLPNRATGQAMPKVYVSDMRDELKRGNRSIFSAALYHAMETCLDQKEQMMLFINRRGYATFLMCRGCGYVVQCPDCDVSMTYHRSAYLEELRCHYCGKTMQPPALCPVCGKPYLKQFGIGTQQVEEQVKLHFPDARVLRMDADTTKGKDAHLKILQAFSQKQADVLIGTQMIAKGHDFENVTLVGVLAADSSLYVPDYRSAERTFQLITQVAGRAGRGALAGKVVVQTYHPDHFAVQSAIQQDYRQFYAQEILHRKAAQFPPYAQFIRFLFRGPHEAVQKACLDSVATLSAYFENHAVTPLQFDYGSAPIAKIKGESRMQILLKLDLPQLKNGLVEKIYRLFDGCYFENCAMILETDPPNLL
jgi:primosomal protein N' (replication factor Y)